MDQFSGKNKTYQNYFFLIFGELTGYNIATFKMLKNFTMQVNSNLP